MRQKRLSRSSNATTVTTTIDSSTSFHLDSPDRPFDNILNFRDVGKSINEFTGSKILKENILFRSARPDDASKRDRQRLQDDISLSTVIDLRSKRRRNSLPASSLEDANIANTPPSYRQHLLELPGVNRHFISLTGRAFERLLLWRLDCLRLPRGCSQAQDTLDCAGAEIREIFDILTKGKSYPVLIHCTQGKDRTGLIILLLLFLIADTSSPALLSTQKEGQQSIPLNAMASDYMKSESELQPEFESLMKEISDIGLDEEYAKTPSGFTGALKSYLDTKYGGVRKYLLSIGVGEEKIDRVIRTLMV
ncbi:hypothetical protein UA08_02843 [Talaromyces atroroseus]|uniref:Tyrosine specific protein phosphatases domain-containing protein n=1 Tax=Talaromyces atroroseus TaxID=1441469 RepID=A0A225AL86_TALAT|nr:hypothetical protein UA08_02843 [Talaromyces atroroseus]OKL62302.1 hypothetical protein UA08_02843 [Talaromyces atroroseus]